MTTPTPAAAFCGICKTIFAFEERDLFANEVFCPSCASRTDVEDRYDGLAKAADFHPEAAVYGSGMRRA